MGLHLSFECRRIGFLRAEFSDLFAQTIAVGLQILQIGLCATTANIYRQDFIQDCVVGRTARGEGSFYGGWIFAEKTEVEHELDRMNKNGTVRRRLS